MKKIFGFIIFILILSCSKENLYDFKDLTETRDYIYMVRVFTKDSTKKVSFSVEVEETNGYNKIITYPYGIGIGAGNNEPFSTHEYAVKGYKKNGVLVIPEENINAVLVRLYEVGSSNTLDGMIYQHFSESSKPIYVGYDFETKERIIEYLEEED